MRPGKCSQAFVFLLRVASLSSIFNYIGVPLPFWTYMFPIASSRALPCELCMNYNVAIDDPFQHVAYTAFESNWSNIVQVFQGF